MCGGGGVECSVLRKITLKRRVRAAHWRDVRPKPTCYLEENKSASSPRPLPLHHVHCYKDWRDFPLPRPGAADSKRT